jgi:uncharacterized protein (DUF58 family)
MPERLFNEAFLRKLERLALLSRKATAGQTQGERRSPKRGQSVEFSDFRPYVSGDDIRRIDWNAYARLERFFIKLFVEEEDLTVHLLIDTSKSMDWGEPNKLDYAIRAAGALGYVALVGLDRVTVTALGDQKREGGRGVNGYLPPTRGKKQALALFSFLQSLPSKGQQARFSPSMRLSAYAANATHTGPLIIFSDLMDDGWMEGINILAGRGFEVSILHLLSPDETRPALDGDLKLVDYESNDRIEITADFETLDRYHQGLAEWQWDWRRFSNARGIHYIPVNTATSLDELLFAWLRQQGVLR